ncbi:hypothetical protein VP01_1853g3 [Puccinia sorghi]|uniref:Uncharacterized protein n=1 Tax=Puccinia sorghi TaxID=27349 RepID=A0A0L6VDK4_9BASI|nr:hypothetical protein VP01_1853g3 [Puccinia sorghi]
MSCFCYMFHGTSDQVGLYCTCTKGLYCTCTKATKHIELNRSLFKNMAPPLCLIFYMPLGAHPKFMCPTNFGKVVICQSMSTTLKFIFLHSLRPPILGNFCAVPTTLMDRMGEIFEQKMSARWRMRRKLSEENEVKRETNWHTCSHEGEVIEIKLGQNARCLRFHVTLVALGEIIQKLCIIIWNSSNLAKNTFSPLKLYTWNKHENIVQEKLWNPQNDPNVIHIWCCGFYYLIYICIYFFWQFLKVLAKQITRAVSMALAQVELRMKLVVNCVDFKINNQNDILPKFISRDSYHLLTKAYITFSHPICIKNIFEFQKNAKIPNETVVIHARGLIFCLEMIMTHISYGHHFMTLILHHSASLGSIPLDNPNHGRLTKPTQISQPIKICQPTKHFPMF